MTLLQVDGHFECSECGARLNDRGFVQMALIFDMTSLRVEEGRLVLEWNTPAVARDFYCRACGADVGGRVEVVQEQTPPLRAKAVTGGNTGTA